ncbi:uncharacterized protein LOC125334835 [Corvus hawaiiensis]|uniref:uncharacterized protein LOC125334835 n=1 Tax=Corvus hawaiiensis TaxID=134902 RepID=UPI002018F032|nr:uncharacterized protein LOC125334835 [Corvus hawaiiensis]
MGTGTWGHYQRRQRREPGARGIRGAAGEPPRNLFGSRSAVFQRCLQVCGRSLAPGPGWWERSWERLWGRCHPLGLSPKTPTQPRAQQGPGQDQGRLSTFPVIVKSRGESGKSGNVPGSSTTEVSGRVKSDSVIPNPGIWGRGPAVAPPERVPPLGGVWGLRHPRRERHCPGSRGIIPRNPGLAPLPVPAPVCRFAAVAPSGGSSSRDFPHWKQENRSSLSHSSRRLRESPLGKVPDPV